MERSCRNTIFTMASTRKSPTPTPTTAMSAVESITALTCSASTERSGSAIVISTPITNPTPSKTPSFLDLVSPAPTCSPIGVMARSAPRLKSPIPIMRKTAHTQNAVSSVAVKSISGVNESTTTMRATGNTEINDSLNLISMRFMGFPNDFLLRFIISYFAPFCNPLNKNFFISAFLDFPLPQ